MGCVIVFLLLASCGAQHKRADEVEHVFNKPAKSLALKMMNACQTIANDQNGPNLIGLDFAQVACTNPDRNAIELRNMSQFAFEATSSDGQKFSTENIGSNSENKVSHLKTMAAIWLNHSLTSAAGKALGALKDGSFAEPTGEKAMDFEVINQSSLSDENLSILVNARFNSPASANDLKNIEHDVVLKGKVVNGDSFVVSIETAAPQTREKSLFQDFKVVAVVIPHAGDIFVKFMLYTRIHSFSVDKIVNESILTFLADMIDDVTKRLLELP
jgi:hypothetical protein